jgi:hypothetical protein
MLRLYLYRASAKCGRAGLPEMENGPNAIHMLHSPMLRIVLHASGEPTCWRCDDNCASTALHILLFVTARLDTGHKGALCPVSLVRIGTHVPARQPATTISNGGWQRCSTRKGRSNGWVNRLKIGEENCHKRKCGEEIMADRLIWERRWTSTNQTFVSRRKFSPMPSPQASHFRKVPCELPAELSW